uniref:Uncharacterized protein n=1 Tax=Panagrolaimus sp. PS1159 TaxID=55785 RepID=A0AC35GSK3_9BILA
MDSSNDDTLNRAFLESSNYSFNSSQLESTNDSINFSPSNNSVNISEDTPKATTGLEFSYLSSYTNGEHSSESSPTNVSKLSLSPRPPIRVHNLIPYESRFPPIRQFDDCKQPKPLQTFTCFDVLWKFFWGPKSRTKSLKKK